MTNTEHERAFAAGREAVIREAAEVQIRAGDTPASIRSRILALIDSAPAPAGMAAKTLAFHMYPKDMRGNYEQREDFPEYVRMAEIAIRLLSEDRT